MKQPKPMTQKLLGALSGTSQGILGQLRSWPWHNSALCSVRLWDEVMPPLQMLRTEALAARYGLSAVHRK